MIALCGCMMQEPTGVEKIRKSYRFVNLIFGTHNIYKFAELLCRSMESDSMIVDIWKDTDKIVEDLPIKRKYPFKSGVNIMFGCNNFCTYCIIPWARGTVRSQKPEVVIEQVKQLVEHGHCEVVLTGIHTAAYGEDLEDYSFGKLLQDLIEIEGLKRIRISSIEASEVTDDVIAAMKKSDKIVNHLHMPIQAGSDTILKGMKRPYTLAEFEQKVTELRELFDNLAITTDVIVGFPGETEELFNETLETIKRIGFSELHVFPYSVRNGTPAARMENQVPELIKSMRVNQLLALSEQLAKEYASSCEGKVLQVIPEEVSHTNEGYLVGHASNYVKVEFKGIPDLIGEVVPVKVVKADYPICQGEMVK